MTAAQAVPIEQLLSLLLESVVDYAIFVLDPQGNVVTWNPGAERMKGYTADEIVGRHFSVFYTADDVAAGRPDKELATAAAMGRVEDEGWRVRQDGGLFWANVIITALRDQRQVLLGFAKVTRDLTARRSAEEELSRANQELQLHALALQRSIEELEQVAAAVSHDLSEPVRVVAYFAQHLRTRLADQLDEDSRTFFEYILGSASRMQRLIDDLLAYSSVAAARAPLEDVDLGAVVSACLDDLSASIIRARAAVRVGPLPVIRGDATSMRRLFQNLISNAIKFVDPARIPAVAVTARRDDHGWRVSVADNGLGIDLQDRERAFSMFMRLHPGADQPGTGVGLAICRKIVEQRGGRIWIEDNPGGGSVFRFTIPDGAPGS